MSNNLRQIARDLRSFVKRCKNVHYSDSLLISFLITGLLTIAPKLHADVADVASEQQEVTAQTYDAITDLRQSFMRARKENEKSLKGAQSELVQLLRQGDQVIKSPWSSFQFGTGYMNNDWGTTYRGRGGKFLEYYKRDNDLTKYVFDPTKHLYGATNLNIPRNKEPNSLTINPANIHEPYKPYVPERLDNINMPVNPTFDPTVYSPRQVERNLNASNSVNRSVTANTNYVGGTAGAWSHDSTFTYGASDLYRSWNGWVDVTRNTYKDASNTDNSLGTTIGGASAASEGDMTIGTNVTHTTSINHATGVSTGSPSWWNPTRTWTATVEYSNLNNPHWGTGTTESYTPAGGTSGFDGITANNPTSGWWYDYWGYGSGANSSYQQTWVRNYHSDVNHRDEYIGGSGVTYNQIYATTPTPPSSPGGNYTITLGGQTGSGSTPGAAQLDLFYKLVDNQYQNYWGNWYTAYRKGWTPSGSSDSDRDVLISNIGKTGIKLENFNAHVLGVNDGFAQIQGGTTDAKYTVNNVEVDLNGSGNQAAFIIDTNSNKKAEIAFGTSNGEEMNKIYDRGHAGLNQDVIFNFQSGNIIYNKSEAVISGTVDVELKGNNTNVSVYRVNDYIHKLDIANGDSNNSSGTLGKDNLQTSDGTTTGKGRIWVNGNDNVVYDGQGFVDTGSALTLSDVQMNGNNNVMVALRKPSGNVNGNARVGAFEGDIMIQGGMYGDNNVVVDAASGQGSGIGKQHISAGLSGTLNNVKIAKINVGFGAQNGGTTFGKDNTMIKATNGTTVEVTGKNAVISDSVYWNKGAVERDFNNMYLNSVASHTIVGYANGTIQSAGYADSVTTAIKPSRIEFKTPVDMAGKATNNDPALGSIAYFATNSGSIDAQATRAAAPQSIIAYADGGNAVASMSNPQINIAGNINATDFLVLHVKGSAATDPETRYGNGTIGARPYTYQNIGAYANNGGTIKVVGTAQSTDATAYKSDKSLIYGIGALADGNGSHIRMEKVSVVSGASGALFAKNGGVIEYENGNILHQNNKALGNGDIALSSSSDKVFTTGVRKGMDAASPTDNDHENISPFYVYRSGPNDKASIIFSGTNNIDMYDGILLTGNAYYNGAGYIKLGDSTDREWDYANSAWENGTTEQQNVYKNAKYKGTNKVTANILKDGVTVGIINQADKEINWNSDKNQGTGTGLAAGNFLSGIGEYAGGMIIKNNGKYNFDVSLINSKLKVSEAIDLEDKVKTRTGTQTNDPFNNIKMESTKVTLAADVTGDVRGKDRIIKGVHGDNYQLENVGLSMANTLFRWDDLYKINNPVWRKTKNTESGFWVETGKNVTITGGQKDNPVTALNVSYGTVDNSGKLTVDHGNGIVGTDNSILNLTKDGTITVSGKYTNVSTLSGGSENYGQPTESDPTGANYGIVGISRKDNHYSNSYTIDGSSVDTDAIKISSAGIIKVDGGESVDGAVTATGIYAKNVNADHSNVTIDFDDTQTGNKAGIEVQNNGSKSGSRGVGIALVNEHSYGNGGIITLNGHPGNLGSATNTDNNIITKENGIGIYGENADIILKSDKFTITTKDDGVGIWVTDNAKIAEHANHTKTFEYNYEGKNNKNGFAMVFGGRNTGITHASNDLDIKFSNHATNPVDLAYEQAKSKVAAVDGGTYKGIAGILVNTNNGADTVTNRGNIEEDKSKTNIRAYGAVVNKGTFVNFGK
ncbi:autotransporter-associated N-terminal domain-containing protein, partial [Leptotrichia wadei]|uniref:autotransporter-associated N-terminal domain-containing protein n=1 Tax=Leptotrichia wadei TaxID=157687 RepID=UPI0028D45E27